MRACYSQRARKAHASEGAHVVIGVTLELAVRKHLAYPGAGRQRAPAVAARSARVGASIPFRPPKRIGQPGSEL